MKAVNGERFLDAIARLRGALGFRCISSRCSPSSARFAAVQSSSA
jgi:hypothetical protein